MQDHSRQPTRRALAVTTAALLVFTTGMAHAAAPLALFGTPLHSASRAELRQTLEKAGLAPQRVQDGYFCDEYGVNGQLKGASQLTVCYTDGDERFAIAEYTFESFMDMQQVNKVIDTVASKYGRPGWSAATSAWAR